MSVRPSLTLLALLIGLFCLTACGEAPPISGNNAADLRTLPAKSERPTAVVPTSPLIGGDGGTRRMNLLPGPVPPSADVAPTRAEAPVALSGEPVNLTIEQMPLPAFINTVFGDTLHLTYAVDPKIAQRADPVTLRTGGPRTPSEVLALARQVLRDYGIQVTIEGRLVRILPNEVLLSQTPEIISGRSTPNIAASLRPIYQHVTLSGVAAPDMAAWLQSAFGAKLKITPAAQENGLLILGLPEDVLAANEAIRTLDQPRFAGRRSLRIEPAFWAATQLADKLAEILRAEGYNTATSLDHPAAVVLLPLKPNNSLVVFAADQKTLSHVEDWARDLDRVSKVDPQRSLFYYAVRNTTADSLASVLNSVLQGSNTPRPTAATAEVGAAAGQASPSGTTAPASGGGPPPGTPQAPRIVTDAARNALIFQGSADEFGRLRPLIENLDHAPRAAIIEATVVEVTLSNDDKLGVEGSITFGLFGQKMSLADTQTGIGSSGFSYTIFNSAGAARATLNAFATDTRAKVLSNPKLLSRSGAEARIQVGKQVPIVTSQGTSSQQLGTAGNAGILQNIQYRDTGVILTVRPTIYAGNQIDLDIKQEVSEPLTNNTSGLSTPVINNRSINTQLSLRDGATVLLGGLIQDNINDTSTGVPVLKDIPGLGYLFGTGEASRTRSELFVFLTPYIVTSDAEAKGLADVFKDQYESLPQPKSTLFPKLPPLAR